MVYKQLLKCTLYFIVVFLIALLVDKFMGAYNIFILIIELGISVILGVVVSIPFFSKQNITMLDMVIPVIVILKKMKVLKV